MQKNDGCTKFVSAFRRRKSSRSVLIVILIAQWEQGKSEMKTKNNDLVPSRPEHVLSDICFAFLQEIEARSEQNLKFKLKS